MIRQIILTFLVFVSPAFPLFSQTLIEGPISAELLNVIDAEKIEIRSAFPSATKQTHLIKLMGIDAPSLNGACTQERKLARAAKQRLQKLLGKKVALKNILWEGGGRSSIAQVFSKDGSDPAYILIKEGLARAYWGGHLFGWCADQTTCLVKNCD